MPVINGSSFFVDGKCLYLEMLTVNTFLSTVNIIKMQVLTVNTFSMTVLHSNENIVNGKHLFSDRNLQAFILTRDVVNDSLQ